MAPQEKAKTTADFQPIPLHSLRTNTITNFDIYIEVSEPTDPGKFVLYRNRDIPFLEDTREKLLDHGTDVLYIDASDRKEYQVYLESNLEAIIEDEDVPPAEKSKAAYECATGLVEGLLDDPRSGEHVKRAKPFISSLVNYMLNDSHAFFNLMASISFDYCTYTHCVNVAVFGIALAHRLGRYSQHTINTIGSGLILHDVGKGLIDQRILNKQGPLNKREWAVMKQHPAEGARLLQTVGEVSEQALIIVEDHHEKLDGSGYPRGLKGDAIHQYARIAAIADIFDALTTQRPHRPAMRSFPALEIMRNEMGEAIDRDLFREFVLLLGDQGRGT
jgi:HD-GYP domain-containing protein (c-di-GMP phosphodiesterase class II)